MTESEFTPLPDPDKLEEAKIRKHFAIYDRVGSKLKTMRDDLELKPDIRIDRALRTKVALEIIRRKLPPESAEDVIRTKFKHLLYRHEGIPFEDAPQKSGCLTVLCLGAFVMLTLVGLTGWIWLA